MLFSVNSLLEDMVTYLTDEEIVEINRLALESQGELDEYSLQRRDDLLFSINFIENQDTNDYHSVALSYCLSIIVLHPFKNGNHRTSLYSAERFLIKNGYKFKGNPKTHLDLQKWRIEYEEENEMEREFFRITCLENDDERTIEINNLMDSQYGITIKNWLLKYYPKY